MSKIVRHTANGAEWLLVGVPNGAVDLSIVENIIGVRFSLKYKIYTRQEPTIAYSAKYIGLGEGKYQFQFLVSTATEEQAADVVDKHPLMSGNFFSNYNWLEWFCKTATESLQSLTRSHGFTEDVAVIKIIN